MNAKGCLNFVWSLKSSHLNLQKLLSRINMDMKSLAKSKRAHSLHHSKKHHPHQASKAPSSSSGDKKPSGKQAKEKPPQSHGPKTLPSNWDRYDADLDLGEDTALVSSSQPAEFVVPKSKGADFAHLISEAKAQSQTDYSSDVFSLFDDVIQDFSQDFGPMLAAKGQSMLSWIADDSFDFEDKASNSVEAHFLSLNLDTLTEQLAKTKLSERLFLEPDLLPAELLDDEDRHVTQTHTSSTEIDSGVSSSSSSLGFNQEGSLPIQASEEEPKPIKQIKGEILQKQVTDISFPSSPVSKRDPPAFEAENAEAELDMLLNSFTEIEILEPSSSIGIPSNVTTADDNVKKTHTMNKPANIDDDIDKLLEETSHEVKQSPDDISKSKLLDDFDSWLDTI